MNNTDATRDLYLKLNNHIDTQLTTSSADIQFDIDGIPAAVGPTEHMDRTLMSVIVTADELAAAGLTPQDVPHLTVIEN